MYALTKFSRIYYLVCAAETGMAWKVNSEVYIRHRFVLPTGERDLMDQEDDGKDVEAMVTCSSLRKKITRHYTIFTV